MICTFFGHRFVPQKIEPTLRSTLIDLIENHGADLFTSAITGTSTRWSAGFCVGFQPGT